MTKREDHQEEAGRYGNINLKVSEDERWAFKAWCAQHRMSQVDAFRRAFVLLKQEVMSKSSNVEKKKLK